LIEKGNRYVTVGHVRQAGEPTVDIAWNVFTDTDSVPKDKVLYHVVETIAHLLILSWWLGV
jgi:hypothetical protein